MLYELSTPFLNIHWFFDKLGMTGTKAQLYNGLILLSVFFGCRLVWGAYSSFNIYRDVWNALHLSSSAKFETNSELTRFGSDRSLPMWLVIIYMGGHVTLQALNVFCTCPVSLNLLHGTVLIPRHSGFGKMSAAVKKRFVKVEKKE